MDNAGIAIAAPLEFLPPEELTRQLDVNVVGQLRVLQAFLPALRRSRGRIVLMGSIGGRSALPFLGAYAMSKFALEAMADALRIELAPFGDASRDRRARDDRHADLVEAAADGRGVPRRGDRVVRCTSDEVPAPRSRARARSAVPPLEVAKAVEHALTSAKPKTRYVVGPDAKRRARVQKLPDRVRDRVLTRFLFGS